MAPAVTVPPELDGERLDKAVAVLAGVSRAEARALLDAGAVSVDGRQAPARERVRAGQEVKVAPVEPRPLLVPEPLPVVVVFEDDDLLVVDKPPGIVVHPGAGTREGTLAARLLARYPELEGVGEEGRWGIVHRLDRDTSGLLVVARTAAAHEALSAALRRREVHRRYLALVVGVPDAPTGTIDGPLGPDPARPTRRRVTPTGKPARTHYRQLSRWPGASLLEVTLETGRTHQIRVHLSAVGHPVVGDTVYGRPGAVSAPRMFLHASRLELAHPRTGEPLVVESPLPEDLAAVLAGLGPPEG